MSNHRCAIFTCLLVLASCLVARPTAAEQPPIFFALPATEGSVTLGVFSENDELIRILHWQEPLENFITGLDGLRTDWDEKDQHGHRVPEGEYEIRGYLVEEIPPQWGTEMVYPPGELVDFGFLSETTLWMVFENDSERFAYQWDPESQNPVAEIPLPASTSEPWAILPRADGEWVVACGEPLEIWSGSRSIEPPPMDAPLGEDLFVARDPSGQLVLGIGNELFLRSPAEEWIPLPAMETPIKAMATVAAGVLVLSDQQIYLLHSNQELVALDIPALQNPISLTAGGGETFWVIDQIDGDTFLREFTLEGEFLREMPGNADVPFKKIRVEASNNNLLLLSGAEGSYLQLLRKTDSEEEGISFWQTVMVASLPGPPALSAIEVDLPPNPLLDDQSRQVKLRVSKVNGLGAVLVDSTGLPLLFLGPEEQFSDPALVEQAGPRIEVRPDRNRPGPILQIPLPIVAYEIDAGRTTVGEESGEVEPESPDPVEQFD